MSNIGYVDVVTLVKTLLGGSLAKRQEDTLTGCYCLPRVKRHTHYPTDQLKLGSANGILILSQDTLGAVTPYKILPTNNYREQIDVIRPMMSSVVKSIVVIVGINQNGPSTVYKLNIKH